MLTNTERGRYPGAFASPNDTPEATFGRDKLAIIEEWKPTLDRKLVYEVKKPFDMEYGPVGPQIDFVDGKYRYLPGGEQVRLMYKDYMNAVPNKENRFTNDSYLEVVSNSKLPKVKK